MSVTTYYISRVVTVPPFVACAAFDDLASEFSTLVIDTENGQLHIDTQSLRRDRATLHALGLMRAPGGRMACALEIEPWSSRKTQLGLRPQRWGPRAWPNHRQLSSGHAALGVLAEELKEWSETPLRNWAAGWTRAAVRNVTE